VELRNRELLTNEYRRVIADRGVSHVYNWWGRMPELRDQLALVAPTAPFVVARLLLRPGTTYAERKEAFAPFDRLQDESEAMRDDVVALAKAARAAGATCDVLVNNKAEGSSPLTVRALAQRLAAGDRP
jgi:acetyl esterase/lipase